MYKKYLVTNIKFESDKNDIIVPKVFAEHFWLMQSFFRSYAFDMIEIDYDYVEIKELSASTALVGAYQPMDFDLAGTPNKPGITYTVQLMYPKVYVVEINDNDLDRELPNALEVAIYEKLTDKLPVDFLWHIKNL